MDVLWSYAHHVFSDTFLLLGCVFRSNIQVKTHAQVMMKKFDEGQDIFIGLDEYLQDPEAYGRPPADDPVWDVTTRYEEVVDGPKKTGPLPQSIRKPNTKASSIPRSSWIKLSHKVRRLQIQLLFSACTSTPVSSHSYI